MLQVSVIVCTKDRYGHLKTCLRSITSTDWPCTELIVVDGSFDDLTRKKNEKLVKSIGGMYYYEKKHGLSPARNLGIRESNEDIVVFADDDFIVRKGWIRNLIRNYGNPEVVCCTGNMLSFRNDMASGLFERSMSFDRGNN